MSTAADEVFRPRARAGRTRRAEPFFRAGGLGASTPNPQSRAPQGEPAAIKLHSSIAASIFAYIHVKLF